MELARRCISEKICIKLCIRQLILPCPSRGYDRSTSHNVLVLIVDEIFLVRYKILQDKNIKGLCMNTRLKSTMAGRLIVCIIALLYFLGCGDDSEKIQM